MAAPKKNADSIKKRAPARPRTKKKDVAFGDALASVMAEEPAEYKVTVHREAKMAVSEPAAEQPPFNADAAFLAPEAMSFDLKLSKRAKAAQEKPLKKSRGFGRMFLYLVTLIVLVAAITAVVLAFQASQQLARGSGDQAPAALNPIPTSVAPTPAAGVAYKLGAFNVPQAVSAALSSVLVADAPNISVDSSAQSFIPAGATTTITPDTLFIKTSAETESSVILAELAKLGLQPKLSVNDGISDDFTLYLASPPVATDLSTYTATVVNASGVSGAAKKYCAYLTTYKVSSCVPQNAATRKTGGIQVSYTDVKAMVQIARTSEFQGASFAQVAPTAQATTVVVMVGK